MNITIPFSKEILFKSKIAEITSISLEHDVSINEKELLGDFIVSGDYKNLDVNVDTNPFSHIVPFSVELDSDIDLETLKYEIEDFSYEIKDEDILLVNILFHVSADKIINRHEELFEKPTENVFEKKNKDYYDEKLYENENKTTKEVVSSKTTNDDFSSELPFTLGFVESINKANWFKDKFRQVSFFDARIADFACGNGLHCDGSYNNDDNEKACYRFKFNEKKQLDCVEISNDKSY